MISIFRQLKRIEPNIRVCGQLLNTQVSLFSSQNRSPNAVKRKKGKAIEAPVS